MPDYDFADHDEPLTSEGMDSIEDKPLTEVWTPAERARALEADWRSTWGRPTVARTTPATSKRYPELPATTPHAWETAFLSAVDPRPQPFTIRDEFGQSSYGGATPYDTRPWDSPEADMAGDMRKAYESVRSPHAYGHTVDGSMLTVDSLLSNPTMVARRLRSMLEQEGVLWSLTPTPKLTRRQRIARKVRVRIWGAREFLARKIDPFNEHD